MISFATVPPNFRTLCIISAASFSRSPSFLPIVTTVSSSLSESPPSSSEFNRLDIIFDIFSKNQTNGESIIESISTGRATIREIFSEFCAAKVFGVISPKTKIKKVITPVAIPIPAEPNKSMNRTVAREAAPMLTRLFPMSMVIISLWGLCFILSRTDAPFLPCLTRDFTFIWLIDISAVSMPEKNADKKSSTNRIKIWIPNIYDLLIC